MFRSLLNVQKLVAIKATYSAGKGLKLCVIRTLQRKMLATIA